ncbi:hypothetical protein [Pseudomonas sp.]|uniref:hypothetical protein n=2 Tax=Pseudomonas sp. TaxID=306 RepID=UPI003FD75E2B
MNIQIEKGHADLMMDCSVFMSVIAGLVADDACEQNDQECGRPFLNQYRLDGLMRGLKMASESLAERSEWLSERVEKEEKQQEEMTKAAQQRRQGRDSNLVGSVGAECGRACTA